MKGYSNIAILMLFFTFSIYMNAMWMMPQWETISLPNIYVAPGTNSLTINGKLQTFKYEKTNEGKPNKVELRVNDAKSFTIPFPTAPMSWYINAKPCDRLGLDYNYTTTQTHIKSDYIQPGRFAGLSFLGSIKNKQVGTSNKNLYSISFHTNECHRGGSEFGFSFNEKGKSATIYFCNNCNLAAGQQWWEWPGINGSQIGDANVDDEGNKVATALSNPSQERYYNIMIAKDGDFIVEVEDPKTKTTEMCFIKKPNWFPNLFQADGNITIIAKKGEDSRTNLGHWDIKEVRVLVAVEK